MNVEKLHAIADAMLEDYKHHDVRGKMKNLSDCLNNTITYPEDPEYQKELAAQLVELKGLLPTLRNNSYPPSWMEIVSHIGGEQYIGVNFLEKITQIIESNAITPVNAYDEIYEAYYGLDMFIDTLNSLVKSCKHLNIDMEELQPGECELGIVVPRKEVSNSLRDFGKELQELNKLFSVFAEISTGSRENFTIRKISSSDLTIFLDLLPEVAACTAVAIERIIALYKTLLEIKKMKSKLEGLGVKKAGTEGITSHMNELMETGIKDLTEDLLNEFSKDLEEGRANEIRTETKFALNKLARRIDRGFGIDVRVEPLVGDIEDMEQTDKNEFINIAKTASGKINYLKTEGEPVLQLPESLEEENKH